MIQTSCFHPLPYKPPFAIDYRYILSKYVLSPDADGGFCPADSLTQCALDVVRISRFKLYTGETTGCAQVDEAM